MAPRGGRGRGGRGGRGGAGNGSGGGGGGGSAGAQVSSRDAVETDVIEEGSEALAVTGAGGGGGGAVVRSGGAGGSGKSVFTKMVEGIPGFAGNASYVARKLLVSTGNAAWIVVTTGLVLALPLIIEMDREAQLVEVWW